MKLIAFLFCALLFSTFAFAQKFEYDDEESLTEFKNSASYKMLDPSVKHTAHAEKTNQEVFNATINLKSDSVPFIQFCNNNRNCFKVEKPNDKNRVDTINFFDKNSSTYSLLVDGKTLIDNDGRKLGTLITREKLLKTERQILIDADSILVNIENLKNKDHWIFRIENDTILNFSHNFNRKSKTHSIKAVFDSQNKYANTAIQIWLLDYYCNYIDETTSTNSDFSGGFLMGLLMGVY